MLGPSLTSSSSPFTWNEASLRSSWASHDAFLCKISDMMMPSNKKPTTGQISATSNTAVRTSTDAAAATATTTAVDNQILEQNPSNNNGKVKATKKRKNKSEQIQTSKIAKRARASQQQQQQQQQSQDNEVIHDDTHKMTHSNNEHVQQLTKDAQPEIMKSIVSVSEDAPAAQASHIESLREKLLKKIQSLRVQRQNHNLTEDGMQISSSQPNHNNTTTCISKRAARRQLKEQRRQAAAASAATTTTTLHVKANTTATTSSHKPSMDNTTLLRKISHQISLSNNTASTNKTTPTVPEDLSGIDFGTLTGLSSSHSTSITDNKSILNIGKKKSLESLLTEAEKKKARLKELKLSEQVEDQQRAANIEWKETLLLARYVHYDRVELEYSSFI